MPLLNASPLLGSPLKKRGGKAKSNESKKMISYNSKSKKSKKRGNLPNYSTSIVRTTASMKNRRSEREEEDDDDDEPEGMSSGLSSGRRCEVPSLYSEDVGKQGVKRKRQIVQASSSHAFQVQVTDEEERRRKERQMRFSSSTPQPTSAADAVLTALSAPRSSSLSSTTKKRKKGKERSNRSSGDGTQRFTGTCQNLEKPYLRLTTFPKREDVRPLPVLKRSLSHIKNRYVETEDYEWANEQLKSVRQDVTVQSIKNDFTLEVYETHARIALEEGALNEFNQCQTMIKSLTLGMSQTKTAGGAGQEAEGDGGADFPMAEKPNENDGVLLQQDEDAADEFGAYRLLYALVQKGWSDVTKELGFATTVGNQKETERDDRDDDDERHHRRSGGSDEKISSCRHAVLVMKAVIHNDYRAFFRLYETAPNLSAYLMDFLVARVRDGAYKAVVASYRPTISVEFFREALRFPDLEETRRFLKQSGAAFVKADGSGGPPFWIDCKKSR